MKVPRTRGAVSGLLIFILGAWAALAPLIGPYFDLSIGSDDAWTWNGDRFLFSVLPGIVAVIGGLMLMGTTNRVGGGFGGWLALAAGAWLVVGQSLSLIWQNVPGYGIALGSDTTQSIALLAYFYATGTAIAALASFAMGRFSVRGVREVELEREAELELERERVGDRDVVTDRDRVEEHGPVMAPPDPSTRVGPAHTGTPVHSGGPPAEEEPPQRPRRRFWSR
jgi:hypothetical protein